MRKMPPGSWKIFRSIKRTSLEGCRDPCRQTAGKTRSSSFRGSMAAMVFSWRHLKKIGSRYGKKRSEIHGFKRGHSLCDRTGGEALPGKAALPVDAPEAGPVPGGYDKFAQGLSGASSGAWNVYVPGDGPDAGIRDRRDQEIPVRPGRRQYYRKRSDEI